ncbi:MAG: SCO family protein, partial [Myxococcales bacterium]
MKTVVSHIVAATLLCGAVPGRAQNNEVPLALKNVDVVEKLGDTVPLDVPFRDAAGREVRLRDYLQPEKPLLLVPAYYECPMLCNLVFNGLVKAIKSTTLGLGEDYRVVTFSIAPKETPELAAKRQRG